MRFFKVFIFSLFISTCLLGQKVDNSFRSTVKSVPIVRSVFLENDDDVLIAGDFCLADDKSVSPILRLNADGTIDESFKAPNFGKDKIRNILSTRNGNVFIFGFDGKITSLLEDGSINSDFQQIGNPWYCYNFWPEDTTFLVQRWKDGFGYSITRFDENGYEDSEFNEPYFFSNSNLDIHDIEILSDGRILVLGNFSSVNNKMYNGIVLLNPDGTIDESFNPGSGIVESYNNGDVAIQDGKFLVMGMFSKYNDLSIPKGLVRLNLDGSLDETFAMGPINGLFSQFPMKISVEQNGKILIVGLDGSSTLNYILARLNSNGDVDNSFTRLTFDAWRYDQIDISINSKNEIVVGSDFKKINGELYGGFAVLDENGVVKNEINPQLWKEGKITDAVVQKDNKIIIVGEFDFVNDISCNAIARINVDGSVDQTFTSDLDFKNHDVILSVALQKSGKILIGGYFDNILNWNDLLLRLNEDGSLDTSFQGQLPALSVGTGVSQIEILSNDQILIAGSFSYVNDVPRNRFARLNVDGTLDENFNSSNFIKEDFRITEMKLFENSGNILLGGEFITPSWTVKGGLMLSDSLGNNVDSFDSNMNLSHITTSLEIINDSVFVYSGYPTQGYYFGTTRVPVFISDWYNNKIDSFSITGLHNTDIARFLDLYRVDSSSLIIGGYFDEVNGFENSGLTKVSMNGGVDIHFNFDVNGGIEKILKYDDDHILIFGQFIEINGNPSYSAAKVKIKNYQPELPEETEIVVNEDSVMNFNASDLAIYDEDDSLSEISITYLSGENYQVENNRLIPTANYSGDLSVNARISDEKVAVDVVFKVIILPVNDAPTILSVLAEHTIAYDSPLTIAADMFEIDDPDNDLSEISVSPKDGANYWLEENVVYVPDWYRGEITVYVTASDGIEQSDPFTFNVRVMTVTALEDQIDDSINIFPNPVTDGILNIQNNIQYQSIQSLCLFDLSGKILYSEDNQFIDLGNNYKIDLNFIDPGLYILKLKSGDSIITKKIKMEK